MPVPSPRTSLNTYGEHVIRATAPLWCVVLMMDTHIIRAHMYASKIT